MRIWRDVRTYRLRTIRRPNSGTLKEETNRVWRLSLPLTEGIHEFLQLRSPLNLEEHLIIVVGHFDIQVLCCTEIFWFTATGAAVV